MDHRGGAGRADRGRSALTAVRERGDVEARLLARQVPPDARVVALVFPPHAPERAARAADAVAAGVARRREHTLLASCEPPGGALDALLGAADSAGFGAALRGDARLTDVAVRREDRPYVYLPAGRHPPDPSELVADAAFRAFVARARDRGGSLLLFVPEELISLPELAELLDGYVALGPVQMVPGAPVPALARLAFEPEEPEGGEAVEEREADDPGEEAAAPRRSAERDPALAEGPAETTAYLDPQPPAPQEQTAPETAGAAPDPGRAESVGPDTGSPPSDEETSVAAPSGLVPPAPEATEPGASGQQPAGQDAERPGTMAAGRRRGAWSRHRERARVPVVRVALGALVIALLVGGWWVFAREAASPTSSGGEAAGEPVLEEPSPAEARSLLAAVDAAPELPYSVLIASYAAAEDARDRLASLRRSGEGLYFVAPTPVRGAIYHRVFAGARAEPETGRTLMDELVEAGRKESASGWDVRPAGLAYRLGVYRTEEAATEASRRLEEAGVPVYVLPAGSEGNRAWQVYAGAYESDAAARPMAAVLERAGRRAELVMRRGEAR